MYRALVTVSTPSVKLLGASRLRTEAENLRRSMTVYGAKAEFGSHHRDPGIWVEAPDRAEFMRALAWGAAVGSMTGWRLTAVCANQESYEAASATNGVAATR